MMFDESMHLLPPEITKCIYDYIPSLTRTVLNKSLYMRFTCPIESVFDKIYPSSNTRDIYATL